MHTCQVCKPLLFAAWLASFSKALVEIKVHLGILFGKVLTFLTGKIPSINLFERKLYSQNGEDGVIEAIFRKIGFSNRFCVELGTGDGSECNCRFLIEQFGLNHVLIDSGDHENPVLDIKREFLTAENINEIFKKYGVPDEFDLLSIDIDYNSFWIWHALDKRYKPKVVVVEYNSTIPFEESKAVRYDPQGKWTGDNVFCTLATRFAHLTSVQTQQVCKPKFLKTSFAPHSSFGRKGPVYLLPQGLEGGRILCLKREENPC